MEKRKADEPAATIKLKHRKKEKQVMNVTETASVNDRALNVQDYAESRINEIRNMRQVLSNSTEHFGSQRVFQRLPRYLRRRAASHCTKRVPLRRRASAIAQNNRDPQPQLMKKKTRRVRRGSGKEFWFGRQEGKKWLSTHVWHAKRFKMAVRWGFKVAINPNEHGLRSAYRAARHQFLMFDRSYMRCVQIKGTKDEIKKWSEACLCRDVNVCGGKYMNGAMGHSNAHLKEMWPLGFICPVEFHWQQKEEMLWTWIHPSAIEQVLTTFKQCSEDVEVTLIEDLATLEIHGPRSLAQVHQVLKLATQVPLWDTLKHAQPSNLPTGKIIALTIQDPRLSLPPKMKLREETSEEDLKTLHTTLLNWPTASESALFTAEKRIKLSETKISESDITKRRQSCILPQDLEPTPADAEIPMLIVIQPNSLKLILPSTYSRELFLHLVFAGAHTSGLLGHNAETRTNGKMVFPDGFVGCVGWREGVEREREEKIGRWKRRPVGKREVYVESDAFEAAFWSVNGGSIESAWEVEQANKSLKDKEKGEDSVEKAKIEASVFDSDAWNKRFDGVDIIVAKSLVARVKECMKMDTSHIFNHDISTWFVGVRIVLDDGLPHKDAAIYAVVRHAREQVQSELVMEEREERVLIGFVTSGGYELSESRGVCFGAVSVEKLIACKQQGVYNVAVMNRRGKKERLGVLEVIV